MLNMGENRDKNKNARNIRAYARAFTNLTDHAETSEKEIEKYLRRRATEAGLVCLKYTNSNEAGYPDRIVLLPDGAVVWVELKSRGRKPTPLQLVRHGQLRAIGHVVWVIDRREQVDSLINTFGHEI